MTLSGSRTRPESDHRSPDACLTADDIAITTDAGEKRFARDAVREVAVRGYSLRRAGDGSGPGVLAVLAPWPVARTKGARPVSPSARLGGAPIGAGLGLVTGAIIPRMKTVYRPPPMRIRFAPARDDGGVGAVRSLALALRVNLDDQLEVEDQVGVKTVGRLTRLTAGEITIRTRPGSRRSHPRPCAQDRRAPAATPTRRC